MSNFAVHDSSTRTLLYYYLTCTHHRVGGFSILESLPTLAQSMSSDLLFFFFLLLD